MAAFHSLSAAAIVSEFIVDARALEVACIEAPIRLAIFMIDVRAAISGAERVVPAPVVELAIVVPAALNWEAMSLDAL